jgi:hypothetical protein
MSLGFPRCHCPLLAGGARWAVRLFVPVGCPPFRLVGNDGLEFACRTVATWMNARRDVGYWAAEFQSPARLRLMSHKTPIVLTEQPKKTANIKVLALMRLARKRKAYTEYECPALKKNTTRCVEVKGKVGLPNRRTRSWKRRASGVARRDVCCLSTCGFLGRQRADQVLNRDFPSRKKIPENEKTGGFMPSKTLPLGISCNDSCE